MLSAALTGQLQAFDAAARAAQPYKSASPLQLAALVTQGNALLTSLDAALLQTAPTLDAESIPDAPAAMITSVLTALALSDDALTLCDLRGYLGRAVLNLSQAQV